MTYISKAITVLCSRCKGRFCEAHGLPNSHNCYEALKREIKEKYLFTAAVFALLEAFMATIQVHTKPSKSKTKSKEKRLKEAVESNNLDAVLNNVGELDSTCSFSECSKHISNFAIQCNHCKEYFCITHSLPEVHGCGEAAKREERRKFLHPPTKLSADKHAQAADKLALKLKQMQLSRKPKQGSEKGKKK